MDTPARKLGILDKRVGRLCGAIKAGEDAACVAKAAEAVRRAKLAVIKARLASIAVFPPDEASANLRAEAERWRSLSVAEIVEAYGQSN